MHRSFVGSSGIIKHSPAGCQHIESGLLMGALHQITLGLVGLSQSKIVRTDEYASLSGELRDHEFGFG